MNPNTDCTLPSELQKAERRMSRVLLRAVVILILAVAAYSIFVAVHEPDSQETVVLGQAKLAADSPASLRILVRNRVSQKPIRHARVELSMQSPSGAKVKLGEFKTDSSGSLANSIDIPALPPGEYQLNVVVVSRLGRDQIVKRVEIHNAAQILLASDKPIYQPGQAIHLRSLIRNSRTDKPIAHESVTFEVNDPKGNKVFKETRSSSSFGIASVDFVLASELNLGRYQIHARAGATSAARTVEVEHFVLPKFKFQITTDKPYYLPGETVSGVLDASYFFSRPVNDALVKLTASTLADGPVPVAESSGRTDAAGRYSFKLCLTNVIAGLSATGGPTRLQLKAEVRDTAGHSEQKLLPLLVTQNELEITAVPEFGALVPSVENILYVLTAYPDGTPAPCTLFVDGMVYLSDAQGICEVKVVPADARQQLAIRAVDSQGRTRQLTYELGADFASASLLLRMDKAVYEAGQTARCRVLSLEKHNTIFIDIIKNGQTVLAKAVPLVNGRVDHAVELPAALTGVLKVNSYVITSSGEARGSSRFICIQPSSGLRIAARVSQSMYRPGEIARFDVSVTDADGKPAPAALGIVAVDESVFARHEACPGLVKQVLDADSDLMKPAHPLKIFDSPRRLFETGNQSLVAAYFASLGESSAGQGLDGLVRNGHISQRSVERARGMMGSPEFEQFRSDPEYTGIVRLLEGRHETYSLMEATGARKFHAVENHRRAYFKSLWRYLRGGFLGLLFFSPVLLLFYHSRSRIQPGVQVSWNRGVERFMGLADSLEKQLAVLVLLPLFCYPVGYFALGRSRMPQPGWVLLAFECAVVLATLFLLHVRLLTATLNRVRPDMRPLQSFLAAFLLQFLVSRAGFAWASFQPRNVEIFVILWCLASVIVPLVILTLLSSHVRRHLLAKGVTPQAGGVTLVGVLLIISICGVLGGLMLPALAKAKAKASRVSLLNDLKQIDLANQMLEAGRINPESPAATSVRVRRDFPETLYWQPELITDDRGHATLDIPLADSITTWRTSMEAVNASGRMGAVEMPLIVFQDFFVDLDLPVSMSLGDQISVPVTCYNYLKEPQEVRFEFRPGKWFESSMETTSVHLGANEVKSVLFPIKVLRVGYQTLLVTARGSKMSDAIEREIRVLPTGERVDFTRNESLKSNASETFAIPRDSIPGSENLWARFYPSRFSEVVEGLESVFRAPYGCFEQTSSTTYPNVLVLDYMKRVGRLNPGIEALARRYINAGYQRLLTFESAGGGFEWFGRNPANICLTAYGILEFTDMSRVHPVDEAVIARARQWLFGQQNKDGSWDEGGRGWTWSGRGSITAFVAWALAESGDRSPQLDLALNYLRRRPEDLSSVYAKALAANAFLARDRQDVFGRQLATELKEAAIPDGTDSIHWASTGYSVTFSHDAGMNTECTALCVMALMKAGSWPQSVKRALTWISGRKIEGGVYGSTQATILAMRALLEASTASLGQEFESTVSVEVNGTPVETFRIHQANNDVLKQVELTRFLRPGDNRIAFRQHPVGELAFQLTGACWLPEAARPSPDPRDSEKLRIEVHYDRTTLAVNEPLRCAVRVENMTTQPINMAMVNLGIPPGFEVNSEAFETMRQTSQIEKFERAGNQFNLYLRELSHLAPFCFEYSMRAKYPLLVQSPASSVYEYYQPQNRGESKSILLQAKHLTDLSERSTR